MSYYRDDLDAARARIETLEAKLKERDAALVAREAELSEIRAEVARMRSGDPQARLDDAEVARSGQRALLVALTACGFVTAMGYAVMHPRRCYYEHAAPVMTPIDVTLLPAAPPELGRLPHRSADVVGRPAGEVADRDALERPARARGGLADAAQDLREARRFDPRAARYVLGDVAELAKTCKPVNGPGGAGVVSLVFNPNGEVREAEVVGGPFVSTSVGDCVADIFYRTARVSAFDGLPVPMTVPFTIE